MTTPPSGSHAPPMAASTAGVDATTAAEAATRGGEKLADERHGSEELAMLPNAHYVRFLYFVRIALQIC
jgi:hypothetical protein